MPEAADAPPHRRDHGARRRRPGRAAALTLAAFAVIAVAGPLLVPDRLVDPVLADGPVLAPPGVGHPLGTDENGVSVLALVVRGARLSLIVALAATALVMIAGIAVGALSGHFTGRPAAAVDAVTEWFLVLPQVPLALVLAAVLPPGAATVVLVVALTSWAPVARTVRAGVRDVEARPFLERARALGAGHVHQFRVHVLPATAPLLAASAVLTAANAVLAEATLSFLGLGGSGRLSWGTTLHHAAAAGAVTGGAWWYVLAPGLAIVTFVLALGALQRALERPRPG
jgi:peptide/nickel transport system permease protein